MTPYDAKINVGCLPLRSEMNYGNIRLRMTLKQMSGVCLYVPLMPFFFFFFFFFQNQQPATLGFTAGKNNRFPAINKNPAVFGKQDFWKQLVLTKGTSSDNGLDFLILVEAALFESRLLKLR